MNGQTLPNRPEAGTRQHGTRKYGTRKQMGEIVDLETYRKRLKRKGARAPGAGNRRNPDRPSPRPEPSAPKAGTGKPRMGDSGKRGSAGNAKIEPNDPKPD